ncbi:inactive hydroxysteroid dehydrogenase-like protein 1 [Astatotilapia calliptera]|uniref:Hydroxysteroid dehydrogenase like 1 n=3 Tax=Haplochromini TaxID=319058 RepID=A0A3Q2WUW3_HAPBU|nr:inactive hydroxysteroid dehydrogenase-like protein 1 [Maylandia zebra]XP_005930536.1 inactive hydroxysteroid dehydrogenase-like protein 1 [Haplochromis burtoni]XP_026050713.1 inactive hydroxysteroid dehydrogenase-like protein 1 [Astatotilapia calliptera]
MAAVDSFQFLYREISRTCNSYFETLALVGALYTASRAVILLSDCCTLVRVHFLPRLIPSKKLTQRYGDWAVVYGASEPVAKAYAEELARHAISIIFVTRDPSSVRDMSAYLSQNYGVETVVVSADFSLDQVACKPIKEALRGKDIGFLVNCVDESLASPQSLIEVPEQHLLDLVNRNIAVTTLMTRLVLPGMVDRSRGAVVNISSGACCRPLLGRVTLTASTGYLDHLSRALHLEYSSKGIFIQSLLPFQIASSEQQPSSSSSSPSRREGWFVPKPEVYARHAISTLGVSNRTTGYWPHTLQYGLMRCIPEWIWVLGSRVLISSS